MRRTWLRGDANIEKRYTIQVAAYNLGLVMRHRFGAGTPRQAAAIAYFTSSEYNIDSNYIFAFVLPSGVMQGAAA